MSLPPLPLLLSAPSPASLTPALSTLFEPSPPLTAHLSPAIATLLSTAGQPQPANYADLIGLCAEVVDAWRDSERAEFLGSHPRIGEVKGLSALSEREQASRRTPEEVLDRLAYLNAAYETRYPRLRYVTFVAGRSRAEIVPELEGLLGLAAGEERDFQPVAVGGEEWRKELARGLGDVWRIGKDRLRALGAE